MKTEEEKKEKKNDKFIKLVFIVNGESVDVEVNENVPLRNAVKKALHESGNDSRPVSDWKVLWNGTTLDLDKKIEDYNLPDCAELYLTLNAGQGGSFMYNFK